MRLFHSRPIVALIILTFALGFSLSLAAQQPQAKPAKPAQSQYPPSQPPAQAQGKAMGGNMTLNAEFVDKDQNAANKAAIVQVSVTGAHIIDPAMAMQKGASMAKPESGAQGHGLTQAHIHYQVDDGPIIATTALKLSFHGLSSGPHKIVVMLAGNDHAPLGPQETLTVNIP